MYSFSRWKDRLLFAQSVDDVRRVMDEYLRTLSSRQIEVVPTACWDSLTVHDIPGSALILMREELTFSGKPEGAALLHEVAFTFIAASNRILAIQGRDEPVSNTKP